MTIAQIALAREASHLAQRVLSGEDFTPGERRVIARWIERALRLKVEGERETPAIRILQEALLDLRGFERSMSAGGGR